MEQNEVIWAMNIVKDQTPGHSNFMIYEFKYNPAKENKEASPAR